MKHHIISLHNILWNEKDFSTDFFLFTFVHTPWTFLYDNQSSLELYNFKGIFFSIYIDLLLFTYFHFLSKYNSTIQWWEIMTDAKFLKHYNYHCLCLVIITSLQWVRCGKIHYSHFKVSIEVIRGLHALRHVTH